MGVECRLGRRCLPRRDQSCCDPFGEGLELATASLGSGRRPLLRKDVLSSGLGLVKVSAQAAEGADSSMQQGLARHPAVDAKFKATKG